MTCRTCGKEKPSMMFRRHVTDGFHDTCKTCRESESNRRSKQKIGKIRGIDMVYDVNGINVVRGVYVKKGIVQVMAKTTGQKWGWVCTLIRDRGEWLVVQVDGNVFDSTPKEGAAFDTVSNAEETIAKILGYEVEEVE